MRFWELDILGSIHRNSGLDVDLMVLRGLSECED
jgi:hypothetical protein